MSKRKRFVLVSLLLTLGLWSTQLISFEQRYSAITLFFVLSVFFSIWALRSDIVGVQWVTVLVLPTLYPLSVALFYFLLPQEPLLQVILLISFGIGMYGLLLTENIYSVAAARTIPLLRVAHAGGFLFTVITSIFLLGTMFGFKLPFWLNGIVTMLCLFPLLLAGLWSATLKRRMGKVIWSQSLSFSFIGGELAMAVSILPIAPLVSAIVVSGYLYVVLGLLQQQAQERLFSKTVQEYILVGLMVILATLFVTYR